MPVWGGMSGLHVWFYRINKNILPLSYGEVWAAQICPVAQMHRANDLCLRIYYRYTALTLPVKVFVIGIPTAVVNVPIGRVPSALQ